MEYSITDFVNVLRNRMYWRFPYEPNIINEVKHKGRTGHIRDIAFYDNPITNVSEDIISFEIGNEYAESNYPYYHILEDAPIIRKRYKGTDKTRGSQAEITKLRARDYGKVSWNGKSFVKEYSKNIRCKRYSVVENPTRYVAIANGEKVKIKKESLSYENIHYQYIEKMLNEILPTLANEFGLRYVSHASTGLKEEFLTDQYSLGIMGLDEVSDIVETLRIM